MERKKKNFYWIILYRLNTWIKENPNKCFLPENRHPLKDKEEVDFEL